MCKTTIGFTAIAGQRTNLERTEKIYDSFHLVQLQHLVTIYNGSPFSGTSHASASPSPSGGCTCAFRSQLLRNNRLQSSSQTLITATFCNIWVNLDSRPLVMWTMFDVENQRHVRRKILNYLCIKRCTLLRMFGLNSSLFCLIGVSLSRLPAARCFPPVRTACSMR